MRVLQPAGSSTRNNGDDRWCLWAALCRRHAGTPDGPLLLLLGESQHTSSALSECQGRVFFRKASRPLKNYRWREHPPHTTPDQTATHHRTRQIPTVAHGQQKPLYKHKHKEKIECPLWSRNKNRMPSGADRANRMPSGAENARLAQTVLRSESLA